MEVLVMPVYDYQCLKCTKTFSITESMSAHGTRKHRCPACQSTRVQQVIAPFFAQTAKKS